MNKYLEKAVDVAATSKCRYQHGCVVVHRGRVVATATNKKVGNVEECWMRSHIHAEVAAILAAGRYARKSKVYVARILKDGTPAKSKPCKKCQKFMEKYKISQVVWT